MSDAFSRATTRRRALAATAGALVAAAVPGCAWLEGAWNQTGATDVVVHDAADESKTLSITVTPDGADQPHTERTLTVAPGETVTANRSKLPTNTGYTVAVSVEGGPDETFDWADPAVERAPLWVLVDGSRNLTFLLQAG